MVSDTKHLSPSAAFSFGVAGIAIVFVLTLQVLFGRASFNFTTPYFLFVFVSGLIVLPTILYLATKHAKFLLLSLVWVHLTLSTVLIFFDQVNSPFTPLWSAFILLTGIYYGWKGFISSALFFVASAVTYLLLFGSDRPLYQGYLPYNVIAVVAVTITVLFSYLFWRIVTDNQETTTELIKSRRAEEAQINRVNVLLNSIHDPVLTLDDSGSIVSQNAATSVFFDTNQSLIGRDLDDMLVLHDEAGQAVSIKSLARDVKSSLVREDISVGTGPGMIRLMIQVSRIRGTFNSNDNGVVVILRDITKEKSLEEEKDEFISVVSHELRTPVAIAEGSLSNFMLLQERGAESTKLRETAEAAHRQVIYLAQMINDLSTLSRAERGVGDDVETINVTDLLHELYKRYEPEAMTKKLTLNLDAPEGLPDVLTSRLYLEEILQNFITNSLKYTKAGSVTIAAKMTEGGKVCFAVSDTGIGMSKTDLNHIFEKFYRSEDYRTRETSGTGLGLYVVHKLAEKLGTKIVVESRLNHGSTFSFELPKQGTQPTRVKSEAPKETVKQVL